MSLLTIAFIILSLTAVKTPGSALPKASGDIEDVIESLRKLQVQVTEVQQRMAEVQKQQNELQQRVQQNEQQVMVLLKRFLVWRLKQDNQNKTKQNFYKLN